MEGKKEELKGKKEGALVVLPTCTVHLVGVIPLTMIPFFSLIQSISMGASVPTNVGYINQQKRKVLLLLT